MIVTIYDERTFGGESIGQLFVATDVLRIPVQNENKTSMYSNRKTRRIQVNLIT